MKIKNYMTMMIAVVTIVIGVCACGSDDDEPEVVVAAQVAGSYTGEQTITIMGEPDKGTVTYQIAKSSDTTVDMTIPQSGSDGPMVIPPITVKNIVLAKNGNDIMGKLASYAGTVTNADGAEKAYTLSDIIVIFRGDAVVVTYSLKYGNMPFEMVTSFTGTKK